MSALLTSELIASTIEQAPIQGRVMLKLLLLQHFDITPEEISYIAADRPDPRRNILYPCRLFPCG